MSGLKNFYSPFLIMERMISESTTFQTITGSADATEAKDRIRLIALQDYDASLPKPQRYIAIPCPRVCIWNLNPSKRRTGSSGYACTVRLVLSLEIEIPSEIGATEDEQFRYCGPLYEDVEDEIAVLGLVPGNLNIQEINHLQSPTPVDTKYTQGRRIWCADVEYVSMG